MFDGSRLRANQQSLTGLLLIRFAQKETGLNYFVIAGIDTKKILSVAKDIPQGLEEIVKRVETTTQRMLTGLKGNTGEAIGTFVYGLGGCMSDPIDSHIIPHDDLDVYELGSCGSEKEFRDHANSVVAWYFSRYNAQQQGKQKTSSAEALKTIAETPAENVTPRLYKLSARLLHAISDRNPIAQLEAEDALHAFAFGNAFRYSVEQIIESASSSCQDRSDLISLQCRIIGAIAQEQYSTAKDLQHLYERSVAQNSSTER